MNRVGREVHVEDCYARKVGEKVYLALKPRGKAWASASLNFKNGTCRWGKLKMREKAAISWVDETVANNHHLHEKGDVDEVG